MDEKTQINESLHQSMVIRKISENFRELPFGVAHVTFRLLNPCAKGDSWVFIVDMTRAHSRNI